MRTRKIGLISLLLFFLMGIGSTIAQSTNSTPLFGAPNSALCSFYKTMNFSAYQTPVIAFIVIGGLLFILWESMQYLMIRKEAKEGGDEAELGKLMSRHMSIIIVTIILMVVFVAIMAMLPIGLCGS